MKIVTFRSATNFNLAAIRNFMTIRHLKFHPFILCLLTLSGTALANRVHDDCSIGVTHRIASRCDANTATPTFSPLAIINIILNNGIVPYNFRMTPEALSGTFIMGCDIMPAPLRMNVGGPDLTADAEGRIFLAGSKFKLYGSGITVGSIITNTNTGAPNGTSSESLYISTLYAPYLDYHFTVPDGTYTVLLHYTESFANGPGQRVFDVYIENAQVENNFDIFVQSGNTQNRALVKSYTTNVTDGDLALKFEREIENITICGIEIIPSATTVTQSVTISGVNVSGCYLNASNQSKTTVSVEVAWENLLYTDSIRVAIGTNVRWIKPGQYETTGSIGSIISPQVVAFELDANNANGTVSASIYNNPSCPSVSQSFVAPGPCPLIACNTGNLGGQVFNDYNANGVKDAAEIYGTSGITVKVTDCNNNMVSTTTGENGLWSISGSIAYPVRVEFSGLPSSVGKDGTVFGSDGGTTVQFISAASCAVDLGVLNPSDYCQATPDIYIPCFVNGDPLPGGSQSGTLDAFIRLPYGSTGENPPITHVASASEVGSLWGVAYDKKRKKIYSSAFLRRHVGLGPLGLGGIYQTNISTNVTTGLVNVESTLSISVGSRTSGEPFYGMNNSARGLSTDPTQPSYDPVSFAQLGKVGIGDLDISDNSDFLYFVNLFDKKLYKLDITGPTPTLVNSYSIPSACTNGAMRPFGLKVKNGLVYVGTVCDGSISKNPGDMRAYVHTFNETTNTFSTIFDFPLNYPKGYPFSGIKPIGLWNAWTDDFNDVNNQYNYSILNFATWPQPMLTDIELDLDGSLILGFADRSGLQMGWHNYAPDLTDMKSYIGSAGGDVLRAAKKGNVYILENNAYVGGLTGYGPNNNQGPGFGEFYNDDFGTVHTEIAFGSLALKPGSGSTIYTAQDPLPSGNNAGGFRYISNTTGLSPSGFASGARVYYNNGDATLSTFGKAVGLGDLELTCGTVSYIEIGNRVWVDNDMDGIQDACEPPIANVVVELYKGATKIAQSTTNSSGEYYFSSKSLADIPADWVGTGADTALIANTAYTIRITNAEGGSQQSALIGTELTISNAITNTSDNIDSDGILTTNNAEIAYTTLDYGYVNHTLDFGFIPVCSVTSITANASSCDINNNTYSISGAIAFLNGPSTGTMTVSVIGGGSQTFNAPFTSPISYSISGLTSDGASHTVNVSFSADGTCTETATYMSPPSCEVTGTCYCKEYIYLNEPEIGSVLKFEVNNSVPLTEVLGANGGTLGTNHWYPGTNTSQLASPHGLAHDLNGRLYIAEGYWGTSDIRRFDCDGNIEPVGPTTIDHTDNYVFNLFSIGNTIYSSRSGGPAAWNSCTGQKIGDMCLNDINGNILDYEGAEHFWGLSYNAFTEMVYVTRRYGDNRAIWSFTRQQLEAGIAGGPCIDMLVPLGTSSTINPGDNFLPNNLAHIMGVTSDNNGNIYVAAWEVQGSTAYSVVLKYNASGQFITKTNLDPRYIVVHGIVWSESTNRIYIANYSDDIAVDCISAFDANTLTYLGTAVPNPGLVGDANNAKALQIIKECCPVNLPSSFQREVCGAVGTKFYLNQEAFDDCDGVVCGSSWTPVGTLTNMTFDACDNSVVVTGSGCGTFTLNIGAVASTGCGAKSSTFTICNTLPSATISTLPGTCNATGPNNNATVQISAASNANIAGISTGSTYTGPAYAGPGTINISSGSGTFTNLVHNTQYTVRVFNGSNDCYIDYNVTTPDIQCCAINAIVPQNILCIDNSTPALMTDNRLRFTATVTNTNTLLSTYNVSVNGGTNISPISGNYGLPIIYTLGPGTAGGGATFTITVTDNAISGCTRTFEVTDPDNCVPTEDCPTPQCGPANIQVNGN